MGAGKALAFFGGIVTLLGTYIFALYSNISGDVGSGIGFVINIPDLFEYADGISTLLDTPIFLYYLYLVLFIIFLASGILQMLSIQSRAVGFVFSLFPLAVGLMIILVEYTTILGINSSFFTSVFSGDHYGDIFPFLVELGDLALGVYLLLAGGILGILSVFMERD